MGVKPRPARLEPRGVAGYREAGRRASFDRRAKEAFSLVYLLAAADRSTHAEPRDPVAADAASGQPLPPHQSSKFEQNITRDIWFAASHDRDFSAVCRIARQLLSKSAADQRLDLLGHVRPQVPKRLLDT